MGKMINFATRFITLVSLLLLGWWGAAQADTAALNVPFVVTNQLEANQCVRCIGPRFRDTGPQQVLPMTPMQEIFTARITDFSPYGGWTCQRLDFDASTGQCNSSPMAAADFCLAEDSGPTTVDLTIAADGSLNTNQPQFCTTDAANITYLGNRNRKRRGMADRDSYALMAVAGNKVIAILQPEANMEQTGTSAILGLRHKSRTTGAKFEKVVSGHLPLRIEATVPETGVYELFVAQPYRWRRAPFRGFYRLSTRGNVLTPRLTEKQDDIEPVIAGDPLSPLPKDAGCYGVAIQIVELGGDLEVSNETQLAIQTKISRNGDVLEDTTLYPNEDLFCCGTDSADNISIDFPPLVTIDLEAHKNGTFVGSTRLQLGGIANRVIEIVENDDCP